MPNSRYTILIIVEGSNTEYLFFNSIRDEILNGNFKPGIDAITIKPEPILDATTDLLESTHRKARPSRSLRSSTLGEEPSVIKGIPPLKWVLEGQKELESGAYDEVWVVFDHDNHPTRKEAFEEAEKEYNGKKVKIAFSSIAFEYYLLMHFIRTYREFIKSECRIKKIVLNCSTGSHPSDCNGDLCIGGYARKNGFWESSKEKESMFPFVAKLLDIGFENAAWVRFQSENIEGHIPIYDRNPYINVDILVKRLIGSDTNLQWICLDKLFAFGEISIIVTSNKQITIRNNGNIAIIIPNNSFCKVSLGNTERILFGERKILYPGDSHNLNNQLFLELNNVSNEKDFCFIFSFGSHKVLFDFEPKIKFKKRPIRKLVEQLNALSHKDLTKLIANIKEITNYNP